LHAVWLAESGKELAPEIPHVLDLTTEALPVQEEVAHAFSAPDLKLRAAAAMRRVLDGIDAELTPAAAPWATNREAFAAATAEAAAGEFPEAFNRWRQLYEGARAQLKDANRKSEMHGLSAEERRTAKIQQAQANEQLALLERGTSSGGSDFYTSAISRPKASSPVTTFRGCRSMPMCRPSAAGQAPRPPISSAHDFLRSRNSARIA
jgi:hypothetical protein